MILKTIKPNDNLDDNETFNSPKNVEIRSRLIPELRKAMFPNYKPNWQTGWAPSISREDHKHNWKKVEKATRTVAEFTTTVAYKM